MAEKVVDNVAIFSTSSDGDITACSSSFVSTQLSDQNMEGYSPWPHLKSFYDPVIEKVMVKTNDGRSLWKGTIKCTRCLTNVRFSTKSTFTLKNHYKNVHPLDVEALKLAIRRGSKRGRSATIEKQGPQCKMFRQNTMLPHFGPFDKAKAATLFQRFMVCDMVPAKLVESRYFADFLKCLNPKFNLPSRRTYMRNVKKFFDELSIGLILLLREVKYVATTADCWSAHRRSFLGMTVHWIDENTLKRRHAVLCCKELTGAHTFDVLADAMQQAHKAFDIESKVVGTTIDNGSNFVKVFREFGEQKESNNEDDTDDPSIPVEIISICDELEETNNDKVALPNHSRCCAHTLNLLATSDVESVPGWSSGTNACFSKTKAKAQALWSRQSSSHVFATSILRNIGRRFLTPCITRWNSLYESFDLLRQLLQTKFTQINNICLSNNIEPFTQTDRDVISEFLLVMQPVAACLNILQSEDEAYMGVLLPTLYVLRTKLEALQDRTDFKYAQSLAFYLLDHPSNEKKRPKGFKGRFGHFFGDVKLLMASAVHPHFKLGVVTRLNSKLLPEVRSRLLEEIFKNIPEQHVVAEVAENEDDEDFFKDLRATPSEDGQIFFLVSKAIDDWMVAKPTWKTQVNLESFPVLHRQAWIEIFLKYNTCIPSSAAIERVFSVRSDIMRPKRSSLSSKNFERFVFIRENEKCLALCTGDRQVKNEEVIQAGAPKKILAGGAKFKKKAILTNANFSILEKIFIKKLGEEQKTNK